MAALMQALDNFYLTKEQLIDTPSLKSGVDAHTERCLRVYGCDRIQRAVTLLQLPQVVAATAQTLLHRFYYKRCLRKWHIRREEGYDNISIEAAHSEPLRRRQEEIATKYEMAIFQALGFICHVDHPHKLMTNLIGYIFFNEVERETRIPDGLAQEAWNLANDSLRTPLSVRFNASTIACGCIWLAARRKGIALPEGGDMPPWWSIVPGVKLENMQTVGEDILSLYLLPKPKYISVNRPTIDRQSELVGSPAISNHDKEGVKEAVQESKPLPQGFAAGSTAQLSGCTPVELPPLPKRADSGSAAAALSDPSAHVESPVRNINGGAGPSMQAGDQRRVHRPASESPTGQHRGRRRTMNSPAQPHSALRPRDGQELASRERSSSVREGRHRPGSRERERWRNDRERGESERSRGQRLEHSRERSKDRRHSRGRRDRRDGTVPSKRPDSRTESRDDSTGHEPVRSKPAHCGTGDHANSASDRGNAGGGLPPPPLRVPLPAPSVDDGRGSDKDNELARLRAMVQKRGSSSVNK